MNHWDDEQGRRTRTTKKDDELDDEQDNEKDDEKDKEYT